MSRTTTAHDAKHEPMSVWRRNLEAGTAQEGDGRVRRGGSVMRSAPRRRSAPTPQSSYIAQAEACLFEAAATSDATARALHEEECSLWLMLARQRKAIEAVVRTYASEADAPA